MDNYRKNGQKTTLALEEKKVKPNEYPKQGTQLSISFKDLEILREESNFMEAICSHDNLNKAYKNVLKNKGSAGIDGMNVDELLPYLKEYGQRIRSQLLAGTFKPQPVKQVEIPKPGSRRTRKLGIPTVIDRFVSQAVLQVLQEHFDPKFSHHSYGFRPRKSAHQAISQAQKYVAEGYKFVVDIDLENFFDRVNHDKLMSEIAKTVKDKRLLKLIRGFLNAGILANGLMRNSKEGTPQGSPLSPLLSNIMLDLLDKELERRKHKFCRFADDCNIYVRSPRAGERVMKSLTNFIERKLKLKVNKSKSSVDKATKGSFLGFSFFKFKGLKIGISSKAIKQFKDTIRALTQRGKWTRMQDVIAKVANYCRGWLAYFGFSHASSKLQSLESWIRRRLRNGYWQQWKTIKNRFKQLCRRGVGKDLAIRMAASSKGSWRISQSQALSFAFPNSYFHEQGIPKFICRNTLIF